MFSGYQYYTGGVFLTLILYRVFHDDHWQGLFQKVAGVKNLNFPIKVFENALAF